MLFILGLSSCGNSPEVNHEIKKQPMIFKYTNQEGRSEMKIIERTNEFIEVELTCIVKADNIKLEDLRIKCINIDPEGMNSMDFLDPSGEFNPGQIYDGENSVGKIRIFLPYEEVGKEIEYAGLEIIDKINPEKTIYSELLN